MKKMMFLTIGLAAVLVAAAAFAASVRAEKRPAPGSLPEVHRDDPAETSPVEYFHDEGPYGVAADWFGFVDPAGDSYTKLEARWAFTPFNPRYMPEGFRNTDTMTGGDSALETFGMLYTEAGPGFVTLLQSLAPADNSLPEGEATQVRSRPAVRQRGEAIDLADDPQGKREWLAGYLNRAEVVRLTWNERGVQFDLIGNLGEEELLKIAFSLTQADEGAGALK